jgi:hypothetical protein
MRGLYDNTVLLFLASCSFIYGRLLLHHLLSEHRCRKGEVFSCLFFACSQKIGTVTFPVVFLIMVLTVDSCWHIFCDLHDYMHFRFFCFVEVVMIGTVSLMCALSVRISKNVFIFFIFFIAIQFE